MAKDKTRFYHTALSFEEGQRSLARALYTSLTDTGLRCYFYPATSAMGKRLAKETRSVYGHLAQSVVVLLSKKYTQKKTTAGELGLIVQRRSLQGSAFPLLPVVTDHIKPADVGLPHDLIYFQWNNNLPELTRAITGSLDPLVRPPGNEPGPSNHLFSVKAGSIKNNISFHTLDGDLNIH